MGALGAFVVERVKSLVSKKVGATAVAEIALVGSGQSAVPPGLPTILYLIVQGLLDGWRHYVDTRYGQRA